jgi:hypothetical protein
METKLCVECRYHFLGHHRGQHGHWCSIASYSPDNINLVTGSRIYNTERCRDQRDDLDRCGKDGRWWKDKTKKQKRIERIDNNHGKIMLAILLSLFAIVTFIVALFLPAGAK